jgi:hypothetical protein
MVREFKYFSLEALANRRNKVDYSSKFEDKLDILLGISILSGLVFLVLGFFTDWAWSASLICLAVVAFLFLLQAMFAEYYEFDSQEQMVYRRTKKFFISSISTVCNYSQMEGLAIFPLNPEEEDSSLQEWSLNIVLRNNEFFTIGEKWSDSDLRVLEKESIQIAKILELPFYRLAEDANLKDALVPILNFALFKHDDDIDSNIKEAEKSNSESVIDKEKVTSQDNEHKEKLREEKFSALKIKRDYEKNRIIVNYDSILESIHFMINIIGAVFLITLSSAYFSGDLPLDFYLICVGSIIGLFIIRTLYEDEATFDLANRKLLIVTRFKTMSITRKVIPFEDIKCLVVNGHLSSSRHRIYWRYQLNVSHGNRFFPLGRNVYESGRDLLIVKASELANAVQLRDIKIENELSLRSIENLDSPQYYTLQEEKANLNGMFFKIIGGTVFFTVLLGYFINA